MAEALLRHCGEDRFVSFSAGYAPKQHPYPRTLELLDNHGIFTEGLHPQNLKSFFESPRSILVDVIVTLSEVACTHCPQWPGDPVRVHWPVDDPMDALSEDEREAKFHRCYETIHNRVEALLKQRAPLSPIDLMFQLRSIAAVV